MKKDRILQGIALLWLVLCQFNSIAQQTTIQGNVTIFNSGTTTGKIKPVVNARVMDEFKRAQRTETNNTGWFELYYHNVNEKDTVSFFVTKAGLEVVNIQPVKAVAGETDTIQIAMAIPEMYLAYRSQMYHTGDERNTRRLEKEIKNNQDSIQFLKAKGRADTAMIESLNLKIAILTYQKERSSRLAAEFVDRYGSIDLDYAPPIFAKAFNLFQSGLVDSAFHMLQESNPKKAVIENARALADRKRADTILHRQITTLEKNQADYVLELRFKADLHISRFEMDSALDCYKTLTLYDAENDRNYFETAYLFDYFYQTDSAIAYYRQTLRHTTNPSVRISTFDNLSDLYERKGEDSLALDALHRSLALCEAGGQQTASTAHDYAATLADMGNFLARRNRPDSAKPYYLSALSIFSSPVMDPRTALTGRIGVEANLGELCVDLQDFMKAFAYLQEAIQLQKSLDGPQVYDSRVASMQLSLANCYTRAHEYERAHKLLDTIFNQYNQQNAAGRSANITQFARIQYDIGVVMEATGQYRDAKNALLQAYAIQKSYYQNYPDNFYTVYIRTLSELGEAYQDLQQPDSARTLLKEVLTVVGAHWNNQPNTPVSDRADALKKLANFLWSENDYSSARQYAEQAVREYTAIAGNNLKILAAEHAEALNLLGIINYYDDQFLAALPQYQEALSLLAFIYRPYSQSFDDFRANLYYNYGTCTGDMHSFDTAKRYLDSATAICLRLIQRKLPYEELLAKVETSVGNWHYDHQDALSARTYYIAAYDYYKNNVDKGMIAYQWQLSEQENLLGNCYVHLRLDSAQYFYLLSFDIRKRYSRLDFNKYAPSFAISCNNLGWLYLRPTQITDLTKSAYYLSKGHDLYTRLDSTYPHQYDSALVESATGLGIALGRLQRCREAKPMFEEVIRICSQGDNRHAQFYLENLSLARRALAETEDCIRSGQ
jgi:hypothetical protein